MDEPSTAPRVLAPPLISLFSTAWRRRSLRRDTPATSTAQHTGFADTHFADTEPAVLSPSPPATDLHDEPAPGSGR